MVVASNNNNKNMFANFTSKPSLNIDWGPRKTPRCIKQSTRKDDNGGKIAAPTTDKLTILPDLGAEAKQTKANSLQIKPNQPDSLQIPPKQPDNSVKNAGALKTRPWNLRTKRAAVFKWEPEAYPTKKTKKTTTTTATTTTTKLKENNAINGDGSEIVGRRKRKFSVCLTEKEIAEDFLSVTGIAPSKRPKKLPKKVQDDIDYISPAIDLAEQTTSLKEEINELKKVELQRFICSQLEQRNLLCPTKAKWFVSSGGSWLYVWVEAV